jgi:hypothetical protein
MPDDPSAPETQLPVSSETHSTIQIQRGRVRRLIIHEVDDAELSLLERGSPESLFLTFAVSLLSTAVSFSVTLLTSTTSTRIYIVFLLLSIVGYLAGAICLALWHRSRISVADVIQRIRARMVDSTVETMQIKYSQESFPPPSQGEG